MLTSGQHITPTLHSCFPAESLGTPAIQTSCVSTNVVNCGQPREITNSNLRLIFADRSMAVAVSDLRSHLEGQLEAKKEALVETEKSLR